MNKQKSGEHTSRPYPLTSRAPQTSPRPYNSRRRSYNHTRETPLDFRLKQTNKNQKNLSPRWVSSRREQPYNPTTSLMPPSNLSNWVLCAALSHPALITVPLLSPCKMPRLTPILPTKGSIIQDVPLLQASPDTRFLFCYSGLCSLCNTTDTILVSVWVPPGVFSWCNASRSKNLSPGDPSSLRSLVMLRPLYGKAEIVTLSFLTVPTGALTGIATVAPTIATHWLEQQPVGPPPVSDHFHGPSRHAELKRIGLPHGRRGRHLRCVAVLGDCCFCINESGLVETHLNRSSNCLKNSRQCNQGTPPFCSFS